MRRSLHNADSCVIDNCGHCPIGIQWGSMFQFTCVELNIMKFKFRNPFSLKTKDKLLHRLNDIESLVHSCEVDVLNKRMDLARAEAQLQVLTNERERLLVIMQNRKQGDADEAF